MSDYLLLENGTDRFLLEDASGLLLNQAAAVAPVDAGTSTWVVAQTALDRVTTIRSTNGFEGGTAGATITTANGGATDTPWDTINIPAGATVTYDNAAGMEGSQAANLTAPGTSGSVTLERLAASFGTQNLIYGRMTFKVSVLPSVVTPIVKIGTTVDTLMGVVRLQTDGTFRILNNANSTVGTGTSAIVANTEYRLEWYFNANTGYAEVRLYPSATSTTATETIVAAAGQDFGSAWNDVQIGMMLATVPAMTMYIDSVEWNNDAWPGAVTAGDVTGSGTSTWTTTDSGSAAKVDQATDTWTTADSGAAAKAQTGADVFTLAQTALDAKADGAADSFSLVQSATEAKADSASDAIVLLQTAAEAKADAVSDIFILLPTGTHTITGGGFVTDAGTDAWIVAQTATEAKADQATEIIVLPEAGAEAKADAGADVVILLPSGTGTIPGAGYVSDAGTSTWVILQTATTAKTDQGADAWIVAQAGADAKAQTGADSFSLLQSATEAKADLGTNVIVLPEAGADSLGDAGQTLIILLPAGPGSSIDPYVWTSMGATPRVRTVGALPRVGAALYIDERVDTGVAEA